jgi:predicted DNA-binding protein with PD1-like motif
MIINKINNNLFVLRIEPNEELFESLLKFADKEKINSGFFYGLGASKNCFIGRYNEKNKDYDWQKINKQMEISSLIGNLTLKENKKYLHIHAVLSDKNLNSIGGHLKELIVYPTCEILFFKFNKKISRQYDKLTNLHLISQLKNFR